jgi:hypothetical protein
MPLSKFSLCRRKVIMELNSDDVAEWKCNNKIIWIANNLTRGLLYSSASSFVSVSHELTSRYKKFNKETLTIGNGISVKDYSFKDKTNNVRPKVCFIGSPGFKWHGIDKIIYIAEKLPEFDFHFIGNNGDSIGNIYYHGYLGKEESSNIISSCDVGVSTMSLHVKDMDEASPLKSRQYLAHGLPIIYAYKDTDLNGDEDFALRISNSTDNVEVHINEIKLFIEKCFNNTELRLESRKFSEDYLDVNVKEKDRLDFFKKLVSLEK